MKEGSGFRDEFQVFSDAGIKIVGVSADPPARQRKFVEKYEFQYPMLCDESHTMLKAYGAWGPKKMAGREYEGIYRITYLVNEEGMVHKVYPKVKPPEHAQQIIEDWIPS